MPTLAPKKPARRRQRTLERAARNNARAAVIMSGVPKPVVTAIDRRGAVDWRRLAGELDGLYMAVGGRLGVQLFWERPSRHFGGATPLSVLKTPVDLGRVADAVRAERHAIERAKVVA